MQKRDAPDSRSEGTPFKPEPISVLKHFSGLSSPPLLSRGAETSMYLLHEPKRLVCCAADFECRSTQLQTRLKFIQA
jgi:hypothetical protein